MVSGEVTVRFCQLADGASVTSASLGEVTAEQHAALTQVIRMDWGVGSRALASRLVLHDRGDAAIPLRAGQELAALIPGATLRVLDGNEHDPFIRDSGAAVESILAFVEARAPTPAVQPQADELTPREREVLQCIARGAANKQIATELGVTVSTVERHITNLYRKLGAGGRADAALAAVALGLVSPTSAG